MIRAVVLDLGSVLEVIDDAMFPEPFEKRHGLTPDQELYDWFAGKRPALRTGIISNSNPGAREAERCWGFEAITDHIVYSHEVGLMKPDPKIFLLGAHRLGVLPSEVVVLDDVEGHVAAAKEVGFHGVVHRSTPESIREVDRIIAEEGHT